AVLRPVGEFVHVSAIYLGLAVLTTLGLSLVLPSMRQQSQQLHEVVLAMFQADGAGYAGDDEGDLQEWSVPPVAQAPEGAAPSDGPADGGADGAVADAGQPAGPAEDRKSTRLNSSHVKISYAVFCLKKKNKSED